MSPTPAFFDVGLIETYAPAGAPVLLALSGGVDSSAAFVLLAAYCAGTGRPLHAAHLDHAIRAESADDADFCGALCARLGAAFHRMRLDVPAMAAADGRGLEETARAARYAWLADVMAEIGAAVLVTAHHAEDNLETMLMHLTRGSGLHGLCGIRPARAFAGGWLLRPFLRATKADLTAVCVEHGIDWRTDATNDDPSYTRNCIRASVLPVLASRNPAVFVRAADTSASLRADEDYLAAAASSLYAALPAPDRADGAWLVGQPDAMRTRLYRLLHAVHAGGAMLEQTHCRALDRLLDGRGGALSLPGGVCARYDGGEVSFLPAPARPTVEDSSPVPPCPAAFGWQDFLPGETQVGLFAAEEEACRENIEENPANIYKLFINRHLNFATIKGQLHWRLRMPGDRLLLHGHHRSVKKLMSAAQMPLALREKLPILCDEAGIVFLPGIGVRDDAAGGCDIAAVRIKTDGD